MTQEELQTCRLFEITKKELEGNNVKTNNN